MPMPSVALSDRCHRLPLRPEPSAACARLQVVKIWDIQEQVCLNTVSSFIPRQVAHKLPPIVSMEWHEASQSIVLASADELAVVQLSREEQVQ